eukprot:CAMPEP_0194322168 /NCGR_PEP_ID=MMETSP0171-20130528/18328_1 /TAXON_ID=218684 /ORGANISM="Corethron pennatum, Strain L29A3" /LENGTH=263 /DNA_ID=CAMNT_0039080349 /DNA_START=56 /DNA_END=847 /DNA_ORIENTATION=+
MYSRPGPALLRRRRAPSVPVLLLLLLSAVSLAVGEVPLTVANRSGVGVRLHWIHPETGEASFVGMYENKGKDTLNTFVGHEFEAREDPEGGGCGGDTCRMARFQVERGDAGKIKYIGSNFVVETLDDEAALLHRDSRVYDMALSEDPDAAFNAPAAEVTVGVVNDAGVVVEILWVDALTQKRETVATVGARRAEAESHHAHWVRTYPGVRFEIREVPSGATGLCGFAGEKRCRTRPFEVERKDNQRINAAEILALDATAEAEN